MPKCKRAEQRTATKTGTKNERSKQAASTYAIGKLTVRKRESEVVQMVTVAISSLLPVASFEYDRLAFLKAENAGSNQLFLSSDDVMNVEEILSDAESKNRLPQYEYFQGCRQ